MNTCPQCARAQLLTPPREFCEMCEFEMRVYVADLMASPRVRCVPITRAESEASHDPCE